MVLGPRSSEGVLTAFGPWFSRKDVFHVGGSLCTRAGA